MRMKCSGYGGFLANGYMNHANDPFSFTDRSHTSTPEYVFTTLSRSPIPHIRLQRLSKKQQPGLWSMRPQEHPPGYLHLICRKCAS